MARNDQTGTVAYLRNHGVTFSLAIKHRLGVVIDPIAGDERVRGWLSIPYLTRAGVRAIKYRNPRYQKGGKGLKYMAPDNQKPRMYNTSAYFEADDVLGLCEGEMDAITASAYLGLPTIGIPGSEMWARYAADWSPSFKNFGTIIMFVDGDEAGRELLKDVRESLDYRLKPIVCDDGMDVSDMIAQGRKGELIEQWHKIVEVRDDDED